MSLIDMPITSQESIAVMTLIVKTAGGRLNRNTEENWKAAN